MKKLPFSFIFSLLLVSCGVELPASYHEKSLTEQTYLENNGDTYVLYFHSLPLSIHLENADGSFQWNHADNPVRFKNVRQRPYFHLYYATDTLTLTNRPIFFSQVINFRDIGGLQTSEGKTVKWGKIFRSDNLSGLKKSEFQKFNDLGIESVYDLRTESEIKGKEDHLPETVHYVHFPTVADKGDLLTQLKGKVMNGEISEEESIRLTLDLYQGSVKENLPAFRALVHEILKSDKPVLYHCSAGKDRTGIVTALVLSVIKVDRQTILDEYLLSNYYRRAKIEKMLGMAKLAKIAKRNMNLKVIENFMKVDTSHMNATFQMIDDQYGGMDMFIKNELGINEQERNKLISKLTY